MGGIVLGGIGEGRGPSCDRASGRATCHGHDEVVQRG